LKKKKTQCHIGFVVPKKLSHCHNLEFYHPYLSLQPDGINLWYFYTKISWFNRIQRLKYLRSTTLGYKDIGFRKSEFVAKTLFLLNSNILFNVVSSPNTKRYIPDTQRNHLLFKWRFKWAVPINENLMDYLMEIII